MAADIKLDRSTDRTAAGKTAGDTYETDLETIVNTLNNKDGQSLGELVESQLKMTEAETKYNVTSGVPGKATKVVNDASGRIKQQGG